MTRVLIIGVTGLLGNALIRVLSQRADWKVYGTVRSVDAKLPFQTDIAVRLISGVYVEQLDTLIKAFTLIRPDVVINCVGLVKQLVGSEDPLRWLPGKMTPLQLFKRTLPR